MAAPSPFGSKPGGTPFGGAKPAAGGTPFGSAKPGGLSFGSKPAGGAPATSTPFGASKPGAAAGGTPFGAPKPAGAPAFGAPKPAGAGVSFSGAFGKKDGQAAASAPSGDAAAAKPAASTPFGSQPGAKPAADGAFKVWYSLVSPSLPLDLSCCRWHIEYACLLFRHESDFTSHHFSPDPRAPPLLTVIPLLLSSHYG